ncbi:MAG: dihydrofolate reductase [Planctomycetes bacterium]|nr:dihydrofolate reductase [Planctomycetota bacterium]
MIVSCIAAVARGGVIGRRGEMPWRLPDDLRRFRAITWGHPVIMGRKTYESIGGPLEGRTNAVLSRSAPRGLPPEVIAADSLDGALERLRGAPGSDEVFVIGGAEVYAAALPRARRLYLTRVDADVEGDARFPEVDFSLWRLARDEPHPADAAHAHPLRFQVYERSGSRGPELES